MTFKHRKGGQWVPVTAIHSPDGVGTLSGGGGTGTTGTGVLSNGKYLLTGDPPTRTTTEYVSSYTDFQTALNTIGPDTRLVIDSASLTGNWTLPTTNNITIDGAGATLSRSDPATHLISSSPGNDFINPVGATGTYTAGQGRIAVDSVTGFKTGDIIRIWDPNQVHPEMPHVNSGGDSGQGVFHVVASVDSGTSELVLEENLILNWDDPAGTLVVETVDYDAVDQRLANITFEGNDAARTGSVRVVDIENRHQFWFDGCTVQNGKDGLSLNSCYQVRVDNSLFQNLGDSTNGTHYPVNISRGTHHTLLTDCNSTGSERYAFKSGSGAWWPCRNGRFVRCHGADTTGRRAFDQHPGAHYFDYIDCSSENCGFARPRSYGWYQEGTTVTNPAQYTWYMRNTATDVEAKRERYQGNVSDRLFQAYVINDIDHVRFTDTWVQPTSAVNGFFKFRHDGTNTLTCHELTVDHVAIGDTWIDQTYFETNRTLTGSWSFPNMNFVTPTDGTTPAEYFGNKYGWA